MKNKGVEIIEAKLELGMTQFSAREVAYLLNQIRILQTLLDKEKGNK